MKTTLQKSGYKTQTSGSKERALKKHSGAPALPLRRPYGRDTSKPSSVTCAGLGMSAVDAPSTLQLGIQVASAAAWAAAAYLGYQVVLQQNASSRKEGERECERCHGTGRVECFCTRWSDGDSGGCGTCGGSRRMACSSCGGGGTAVPIEARVYIHREQDYL